MLRPVIGGSVRRARGLAEVLDMRGFDPVEPRASREPRRLDPREKALALGALGAAAAVVAVKGIYWLYLLELVYSPRLRPLYAFARGWL